MLKSILICPLLTLSAEREEEFTLTETTPTSPSPGSYSPARSVQSVDVSSASSPTAALSPEYPGVTASTGEMGLAHADRKPSSLRAPPYLAPPHRNICFCVCQALFSHIPGPLHTQWPQQAARLQRLDNSCPAWGTALPSRPRPPPTGCRYTPTGRNTGKYHCGVKIN